jgi:putative heme-binding domain-containing protein
MECPFFTTTTMRARIRVVVMSVSLSGLIPSAANAQDGVAVGKKPGEGGLIEYRAAALAAKGDAGRGRQLIEKVDRTKCLACHAVAGRGPTLGPDLAGLGGGRVSVADILDAILEPSAKIHPDYASTVLALKSGRVLEGLVRPINESEVEIVISATETVRLARSEIEEQSPSRTSIMPKGLHEALSPGEFADLLAYLSTLEPASSGTRGEAVNASDIPQAVVPVSFRPIVEKGEPFHRPVWFGQVSGHPGRSAVIEMQRGRVWLLGADGRGRALFVDVLSETIPGELTGLTSLAFHPDFAYNGRYFLKMHAPHEGGRLAVQVVERKATPDGLRDSGEPSKLVLKIPVFSEIHNGGHLAFGTDGFLYIGMGDTGPQNDPRGHGQDLSTLLGKISRIDVDRAESGRLYTIPSDNPFRNSPGARPEVWALGFREPWRFSFDPPTGDLWVGDVGQGLYEEVTIARKGENHGWNVYEGFRSFSDRYAKGATRYVPPVFAYHHRVGVSVTGGFVYRGKKYPAMAGQYICGDYETRRVWAIEQRNRTLTSIVEIGRSPERIVSFGVDSEGEIYVVGFDRGLIYRIDATNADLAAAEPAREVVPTARREAALWRLTESRPPAEWAREDFDDRGWAEAPGGFGTRGTPGATVRTEWRSREIWLRRSVVLPAGDPKTMALSVHHDEDAEIYLNGVLATRLPGFVSDYENVPISEEARAALRPGKNVLAIHCRQTGGGQYIDVGIVQQPRPRPVQ